MAEKGKIVCHFCGGCATSIASKVMTTVADLGDGFADIEFNYIDTSTSSYDKLKDPRGELFLIENKEYNGTTIQGAGGERAIKAKEVLANIPNYLNKQKMFKVDPGVYHAVFFSASGGSGNVSGVYIVKSLLERNIPVFCVVVGDNSSGMYSINTLNALATLNKIAMDFQKPLSLIYVNNTNFYKDGAATAEKDANVYLTTTMTGVSLFLSGQNGELDNQDMLNFIDQSKYRTVQVKPGLYGVHIYSKNIELPEGATPTGMRILTIGEQDFHVNPSILHFKRGYVTNPNALNIIQQEQYPLYMVNYANFFALEEKVLKPMTDNAYNISENIVNSQVSGSAKSSVDEETGLIL